MTRVLKHNKIFTLAFKKKTINAIEFIVSKMELVLYSPDEKIINEGDKLESNIWFLNPAHRERPHVLYFTGQLHRLIRAKNVRDQD